MNPANEFEILRSLHTLWVRGGLSSTVIEILLKDNCGMNLISITDDEIKTESEDGTIKYRIGE